MIITTTFKTSAMTHAVTKSQQLPQQRVALRRKESSEEQSSPSRPMAALAASWLYRTGSTVTLTLVTDFEVREGGSTELSPAVTVVPGPSTALASSMSWLTPPDVVMMDEKKDR
jgi:hypothetical protein